MVAQDLKVPLDSHYLETKTGLPVMKLADFLTHDLISNLVKDAVIILLPHPSVPNYGHWVLFMCLPISGSGLNAKPLFEYFNSLGKPIPVELSDYFLVHLPPGSRVRYSHIPLQKKNSETQTCGRWVIIRYLLRNIPLSRFVSIFSKKISSNIRDYLVTCITND